MAHAWIITSTPRISALVDTGRTYSDTVTALVIGTADVAGVDAAYRLLLDTDQPAEALAPAVAQWAKQHVTAGDMILIPDAPAERVLAGAVAIALGAPIFTGLRSAQHDGTNAHVRIARYGGIAEEDVTLTSAFIVAADGGALCAGAALAAENVEPAGTYVAQVTEQIPANSEGVDVAAATRVVGAGRGFAEQEDLALARSLAQALDAELGCTRPLAEGINWFDKDAYIGISGAHISPELYVCVGVSGQIQHTAGIGGAKTIVAVNDDPDAPIFEVADYGIVGDLYQYVPAIIAELNK